LLGMDILGQADAMQIDYRRAEIQIVLRKAAPGDVTR